MASRSIKLFIAITVVVLVFTVIIFLLYERIVRRPLQNSALQPQQKVLPPSNSGNVQNAPSTQNASSAPQNTS